jgi:hypothetical protein
MQAVEVYEKARVPVVKFRVPGADTAVDITINNVLPLRNTELLRAYASIDPRLKHLIFIIKHWAKRRGIADAYHGTLSSYAWVLMCVFVAQRVGLVPVLQREVPYDVDTVVEVGGEAWRCAYSLDVRRHSEKARGHWITIGGLLTMFFDYFSSRYALPSAIRAL